MPLNLDDTFLANKVCTCLHYMAHNSVRPDPVLDTYPEPPPCRDCGKWPAHPAQNCATCKKLFYRWFQFPLQSKTGRGECWDCMMEWYNETHPVTRVTTQMGFYPPPPCVLPVPKTMASLTSELDDLFGSL